MRTIAENANDFADLRTMGKGDCIYVDKTDYFHRLVTDGGRRLFFIARPRRFGKSLMITTFKAIFEGKRELFKGLKIDESAEAALAQIKERDYAAPYRARNLPIWAIGLSFDSKTRQLTGAVHECLQVSR